MNGDRKMTVMEAVMRGANGVTEPPVIVTVPQKDTRYEAEIDALIDQATEMANEEVGPEESAMTPPHLWSRAFHRHLDLLAFDRGLRAASWIVAEGARQWPRPGR